jgi:TrmH family RNA methyltransferase
MIISSTDNGKIKEIKKLYNKKYRKTEKKFVIEGAHLIYEAYTNGYLLELIKLDSEPFSLDVPTTEVTKHVMDSISMLETPTTTIGICKMREEKLDLGNRVLILDDLQDPGNVGTIIRSAVAFNVDTVVVGENTVDIYNQKTIRASQGMVFNMNIIEENLLSFIPRLKKLNYKIYGTDTENGSALKDIEKRNNCAIIMGNEGNGINPLVKHLCDENIYIKMNHNCESLNVGVAASIILYEFDK